MHWDDIVMMKQEIGECILDRRMTLVVIFVFSPSFFIEVSFPSSRKRMNFSRGSGHVIHQL